MAKGGFDTNWEGDKKIITIDLEEKHKITIKRKRTGPPDSHDGIDGPFDKPPDLDLNHPPQDTIIFTDTNPKCAYYYWNGKWYYK
jgi:hypothetical protein